SFEPDSKLKEQLNSRPPPGLRGPETRRGKLLPPPGPSTVPSPASAAWITLLDWRFNMKARISCMVLALLALAASPAFASFHLWEFRELFSSQDGRFQFIEMHNDNFGEEFLNGLTLRSSSGGTNHDFVFP